VFTSNGTFTIPSGVTNVKVTVVGGGAGGYGGGTTPGNAGSSTVASGTQTISTITGGGGAGWSTFAGGTATGGDINSSGGSGPTLGYNSGSYSINGARGGTSMFGQGPGVYGSGGNGAVDTNGYATPLEGGGGGATAIKWLTGLTPGATLAVTVGAGGSKGTTGTYGTGTQGDGVQGIVIFEW